MKQTRTFDPVGNRYYFDFEVCTAALGWAQVDTRNDASYLGHWANPARLEIVAFIEGDIIRTECESAEEFVSELRRMAEWDGDDWLGIDAMCRPDIELRFQQLGLADLLH